jgi:outer membrane murein-binding lipoprotein Lpp
MEIVDDQVWDVVARAKVVVADVKVGDKVREVLSDGELGRYGTLASIDRSDNENTFGVELEEGFRWLRNVRGEPTGPVADEAESLESARTVLDASQAKVAELEAALNAKDAAKDALTARVETLNEKVAQLETRLRAAEGSSMAAYGQLRAFRREVSEKAYEIVDDGVPCREGMEQWLRDHDCPVKARRTSGTVTIQFDVTDIVVPDDDPDDRWLRGLVSSADLNMDVDCDVSDWRIESVEVGDVESEWE